MAKKKKWEPKPSKRSLVANLRAAAELEHQFTCMYLYAAFSLKKHPDASFSETDLEVTRRWASTIYMVARQEMEHLAIVNQLLGAIGEPPYFARRNFPYHSDFFQAPYIDSSEKDKKRVLKSVGAPDGTPDPFAQKRKRIEAYIKEFLPSGKIPANLNGPIERYVYGEASDEDIELIENTIVDKNGLNPCSIPFLFTPFDLRAARRFTVMESPIAAHLVMTGQTEIAENLYKWGFKGSKKGDNFDCVLPPEWQGGPDADNELKKERGEVSDDIISGDIERYYDNIKQQFEELADGLFVAPDEGRQVKILNQYDIYLFPITDLASAKNGIELIVKQGEAVGSSPGFDSHFRHFYDIAKAYEDKVQKNTVPTVATKATKGKKSTSKTVESALLSNSVTDKIIENCSSDIAYTDFQPFFDILSNPTRPNLHFDYVRNVFDLFNYGYKTMCFCLNGLYGWYSEKETYPFLTQSLRDIVFAPTMTMFIRSVGEILVMLPAKDSDGNIVRAAPNFNMEDPYNCYERQVHQYAASFQTLEITGEDWQTAEEYKFYLNLDFYIERFKNIIDAADQIRKDKKGLDEAMGKAASPEKERVQTCVDYLHQNMVRLTANLWKSYQNNVYEKFRAL